MSTRLSARHGGVKHSPSSELSLAWVINSIMHGLETKNISSRKPNSSGKLNSSFKQNSSSKTRLKRLLHNEVSRFNFIEQILLHKQTRAYNRTLGRYRVYSENQDALNTSSLSVFMSRVLWLKTSSKMWTRGLVFYSTTYKMSRHYIPKYFRILKSSL